ncbi:PH domain-containing protein [Chryseomicrobium palamuruense]|uniref:PH domain-containing protein n=2 Tax=Chryseomicrobium palamuruense TaxID=682973 RepID=A0ABV8UU43_9BACL
MSETRYKLHPVSAVISFVKGLKDLIFPIVILFFVGGSGGSDGGFFSYLPYIFTGLALLLYLVSGLIKWWKFVYWFEDGELRIEYGLFVKKKRYIPFERIQSLDYTESIFHRPFGLVKVKVETAGGGIGEAEAELTAIRLEAAEQIKQEMLAAKRQTVTVSGEEMVPENESPPIQVKVPTDTQVLYKMTTKDLWVLAITSGGIGLIFSGAAFILSQFSEFIPYEAIYDEVVQFLRFGVMIVAAVAFAVLLITFLISVGLTYLQNYGYTVTRDERDILIQRGLLEKKRTTIPMKRIQGIQLVENPLRQLFGYVTIVIDSAGGSVKEKSETVKLVPLLKKEKAVELLTELFPEWEWNPEFVRAPKRSKKFYYRINTTSLLVVGAVLSYFFYPYGLLFFLLVPLSFALDLWSHRSTGIAVYPSYAVMQYRFISRKTVWLEKKRIQAQVQTQTFFEKRADVASLHATIKSGALGSHHSLKAMGATVVNETMQWFLPKR